MRMITSLLLSPGRASRTFGRHTARALSLTHTRNAHQATQLPQAWHQPNPRRASAPFLGPWRPQELSQRLTLSARARARGSREYASAAMGTRNDVASATRGRSAVGCRLANAKIASAAATPATRAALIGRTG